MRRAGRRAEAPGPSPVVDTDATPPQSEVDANPWRTLAERLRSLPATPVEVIEVECPPMPDWTDYDGPPLRDLLGLDDI